jgi:hypothetical protein
MSDGSVASFDFQLSAIFQITEGRTSINIPISDMKIAANTMVFLLRRKRLGNDIMMPEWLHSRKSERTDSTAFRTMRKTPRLAVRRLEPQRFFT